MAAVAPAAGRILDDTLQLYSFPDLVAFFGRISFEIFGLGFGPVSSLVSLRRGRFVGKEEESRVFFLG